MPTFEDPAADAAEVQTALLALAHATRSIEEPGQIYSVLGSLTSAVASLSQSLHQLASFHDSAGRQDVLSGETRAGQAAAYQVSWELHRAGEILSHLSDSIGQDHTAESRITYARREVPSYSSPPVRSTDHGLGL